VGDSKQAKIVPRSYEFTVGYDPDHTGVVKMNLIGNITSSFSRFEMLYDTGYTGAGVVGAWTILKYDASIVFVSKNESDGGTTVQEMINAPIYVVELNPSHPLSEAVLYTDERPIQIENISVQDLSWAVRIVIPKQSMGIPSATYY